MESILDYTTTQNSPEFYFHNVNSKFEPWLEAARERIFSMAAGNRIGKIAPQIMQLGYGKVLYAANELGSDIDTSDSFVLFAPDGTCTYNVERIRRGFTYGAVLHMNFDGMMAVNNSMPNGCGFSIYELNAPPKDEVLVDYLNGVQNRIGQDSLSQLGKGNHFAGLYKVTDPISGEDTNKRFVVVHCSGHAGGDKLYNTDWLGDTMGYHKIETPHGPITLLEGDARQAYNDAFVFTNSTNATNRDTTMDEIFPDMDWKRLEKITHQGIVEKGNIHIIGTQIHDGLMPVAFNPEEGLITVKHIDNLNSDFMSIWDKDERAKNLGVHHRMSRINLTPHGGGYEFRKDIKRFDTYLDKGGVHSFRADFKDGERRSFTHFREIRDVMTYRRRNSIMRQVYIADLAEIVYENQPVKQIYPLESIPGGSH